MILHCTAQYMHRQSPKSPAPTDRTGNPMNLNLNIHRSREKRLLGHEKNLGKSLLTSNWTTDLKTDCVPVFCTPQIALARPFQKDRELLVPILALKNQHRKVCIPFGGVLSLTINFAIYYLSASCLAACNLLIT